jgi:hypothetical protein
VDASFLRRHFDRFWAEINPVVPIVHKATFDHLSADQDLILAILLLSSSRSVREDDRTFARLLLPVLRGRVMQVRGLLAQWLVSTNPAVMQVILRSVSSIDVSKYVASGPEWEGVRPGGGSS